MFYTYNNRPYAIGTDGVLRELSSYDQARAVYGWDEKGLSNEEWAAMNTGGGTTAPGQGTGTTAPSGAATSAAPYTAAPPIDWGFNIGSGSSLPKWAIPAALLVGAVVLLGGKKKRHG